MERPEQPDDAARRITDLVGSRLAAICRWLRAVARAGLVMGLLVVASLAPALVDLPGPWDAVAIAGLAAVPVWLAWSVHRHVRDLRIFTDAAALRAELAQLGDAAGQVQARVEALPAPPTRRLRRLRWSFAYLRGLRAAWSDLDLATRYERLAEPLTPARLAGTSWKVLALAATVVAGPVLVLVALAGEAVVG